ncbi:MAG: VWA domain-containing protein [Bacillota bacterium]|nr:VWA domain-containing protein [Bacillota bacterium]
MNTIICHIPESLENNIIRFVYLLRVEGLRIGNSEVIDALQALQLVPLDEREKVKTSLKVTLIKKAADYGLFESTFDLFFTSPEIREGLRKLRQEKVEEQTKQLKEAGEVLSFRGEKMNLSEVEKTVYSYMPEKEKKRLMDFLEMNESRDTLQRDYRPFLESLVKGRLRFWHKQLHQEIEKDKVSPDLGDEDLNSIRDAAAGSGQGGSAILTEDMQHIARKDLPRATALIRKMARLLVTRISRRFRHSKRRRALDLRSTIRFSIQYGGVPFRLRYKSRRVKKPRLLLLCDVSGSMIRYAGFVLQFIYGLNTAVQRIESFVFSENLERVTPYFQQGQSFESTMAAVVKESDVWGGGTSLHKALHTLLMKYEDELTRNTIIIIVSDTRTIRHQEALIELQRPKGKVKEILWLNTLPLDEWDNYSTVTAFQKLANMFPCNTLADLERVMSRKLLAG